MTERSIDIALTRSEAGADVEEVYESICTLASEPELCFNYATNEDLKKWGFSESCFSCLLKDKKDVIIQVIAKYQHFEGASRAYDANVDYLKNNDYGNTLKTRKIGEDSILFKKKQSDGITYNLLFLKGVVHAAISAKYKKERADNVDHIIELAEKIDEKIN
ncbi:MAG: hypothetical protein O8C58_06935 [Candidatus Methanoperedens sp.]|nr:hypothetical protein [Candidatus Methanoperedens sp.]